MRRRARLRSALRAVALGALGAALLARGASAFVPLSATLSCNPSCVNPTGQTRGGNVSVWALEATGLEDTDGLGAGLPDPYVQFSVPGVTRRSSSVSSSVNPTWPHGGDRLELGAQASGTALAVSVWDQDEGFEGADDLMEQTTLFVIDCACFSSDSSGNATCSKPRCAEEAWVPLRAGANCGGRELWPWAASADPRAACLRVRMEVAPFALSVVSSYRSAGVTTASVLLGANSLPAPGLPWGRVFQDSASDVLDVSTAPALVRGGLIVRTGSVDKYLDYADTYLRVRTNLAATFFLFRRRADDFVAGGPAWLLDPAAGWQRTSASVWALGVRYQAFARNASAGEVVDFGFAQAGMDPAYTNQAMYIVTASFLPYADPPERAYRTEFQQHVFWRILIEMLVATVPFVLLQRSFLRRIAWRMDRIESGVLRAAAGDEQQNLIALVFRSTYQNGSRANVDFRRNLFFVSMAGRLMLCVPVASAVSYGAAMAVVAVPVSAGLAVLQLGSGVALVLYTFASWERAGWRMSRARLAGFALSLAFFYSFLISSVAFDMRVLDTGANYSLFGVTCAALVLNVMPLVLVFFLDNDQLHQAFSQLQRVVNRNAKLAAVKQRFSALGSVGLKIAMLHSKSNLGEQQEQQPQQEEAQVVAARKRADGFGSLLGQIFTVDDREEAFRYSDVIRRWFTGGRRKRRFLVWQAYTASLLVLFAYALLVWFKCDRAFRAQGFGLSFVVALLDASLFALLRGPCLWSTGQYVTLSFAGRACLVAFCGSNWLVGVGLAYVLYGSALGNEIISQRMETLTPDHAGAIAYLGLQQRRGKRANDVSASPEFVLGALSLTFLVALLGFVFSVPEADIPAVQVGGQRWKVWIFGVAAFVVVVVSVVLGLARRALALERDGILQSRLYMLYRWASIPVQLVALAELLVVMSGLLVYAMTGSTFVFISAVFWPVIAGCALKVYSQWCANDFAVFQRAALRAEGAADADSDSEDSDADRLALVDAVDKDADKDGGEAGAVQGRGTAGELADKEREEGEEGEEDEGEAAGLLTGMRSTMAANMAKLNDKLAAEGGIQGIKSKLALPKVPFRKPINLATKVDRKFDDEVEETKAEDVPADPASAALGQMENSTAAASKGQPQDGSSSPAAPAPAAEPAPSKQPKKRRAIPDPPACPDVVGKARGWYEVARTRTRAHYERGRAWAVDVATPRLKRFLEISEQSDPVKMTATEALWNGKLTDTDYSMLRVMGLTASLVFFYGLVLATTETESWWGHTVWYSFFLVTLSAAPVRKYYGTQEISPDMVRCIQASMWLEAIGSIFVFVVVLGADATDSATLWLFFGLLLWPAVLATVVCLAIWRDNDWRLNQMQRSVLRRSFALFGLAAVLALVFVSARAGAALGLVVVAAIVCVELVQIWAQNSFFLPVRFQLLVGSGLDLSTLGFALLTLVAPSNSAIFFCLSLAALSALVRLAARFASLWAAVNRSTPLYFSTFIFPVYSLDPERNELVEQNELAIVMYQALLLLLGWGAGCVVFVDPLEVGLGLVALSLVGTMTLTSWLISRTPLWMASATLCVDEKEIKEAAQAARAAFERRREGFLVRCPEIDDAAAVDRKGMSSLGKFEDAAIRGVAAEKRHSAREMVRAVGKARDKLVHDRTGRPRRDSELNWPAAFSDAFWTGRGPLAPLAFGGMLPVLYRAYRDPASLRRTRAGAKRPAGAGAAAAAAKKSRKVSPEIQAALDDAKVLPDEEEDAEEMDEQQEDQLDRLIDELGPGGDVLKIRVLDWDLTSANDDLGYVEIELDSLESDKVHLDWHDLVTTDQRKAESKEAATGKIQVQVELVNVFSEDPGQALQVRVVVLRGRGLRAADAGGTSDPFCEIECGVFKRRTAIVMKTLDPEWCTARGGGRATFPPADDTLQLEVRDKDLLTSDFLGGTDVYLPDLEPGVESVMTLPLEGGHGKTRATGELKLAVVVSARVNEYGLVRSGASLQVTVISARGLRAADRGGTSDPFCVAKCGLDAFSTSVVQKTLEPKWTESYTFNRDPAAALKVLDGAGAAQDEDDLENVELLDCWKVYQQLPALDAALAREYAEEMRACSLMQLQVVVTAEGRMQREAVLFQRFLREYRFKLLANRIEPPRRIFKSKSWATVDVGLVALWLLRLSQEQRDRFFALKQVFSREVDKVEERRLQEDEELAAHSKALLGWTNQHDRVRGQEQQKDFAMRRERRQQGQAPSLVSLGAPAEPELVTVARERLREIAESKDLVQVTITETTEEVVAPGERSPAATAGLATEAEALPEPAAGASAPAASEPGAGGAKVVPETSASPPPRISKTTKTTTLRVWADPEFPAAPASLAGVYNAHMISGWKRARELSPSVELFAGGTDPEDIAQGVLHNGWFLSALSILAASGGLGDDAVDPLIDNLFVSKTRSDVGAYALRLYKNAQWELVLVDDAVPTLSERYATEANGGVACSHSLRFAEMWVSLLEKAYAKYYGTYAMLENGYVHHALAALTGFDAEEIFLLKDTIGPARLRLWERMMRFSRNGFLMGGGTVANNAANAELLDSGLAFGAVYSVYQVRTVDAYKLIQLRSPPGVTSEWRGDWSDASRLWTTRLKKKLGWTKEEDGTFWMSFDDFCLAFRSLYVCHYYDPAIWRPLTLRGVWDPLLRTAGGLPSQHNLGCRLERNPQWVLDVQRPTDLHIKVAQTLPDGTAVAEPQLFAALLLRCEPGETRVRHVRRVRALARDSIVEWTGAPDRATEKHLDVTLQPGLYVLMVAAFHANSEGPFTVRVDASFPVQAHQLWPRRDKAEPEAANAGVVVPGGAAQQQPEQAAEQSPQQPQPQPQPPPQQQQQPEPTTAKARAKAKAAAAQLRARAKDWLDILGTRIDRLRERVEVAAEAKVSRAYTVARLRLGWAEPLTSLALAGLAGVLAGGISFILIGIVAWLAGILTGTDGTDARDQGFTVGRLLGLYAGIRAAHEVAHALSARLAAKSAHDKRKGIDPDAAREAGLDGDDSDDDDTPAGDEEEGKRGAPHKINAEEIDDILQDRSPTVAEQGAKRAQSPEARQQQPVAQQLPPAQEPPPQSEWVRQFDPQSGNHYYYHTKSGASQWEEPPDFVPGARSQELDSATKIQSVFRSRQSRRQLSGITAAST